MINVQFNTFDYVLILFGILSVFIGVRRGFIREVIALVMWLVAFFIAIMFADDVALYVNQYVKTEFLSVMLSFVCLFIGILMLGVIFNYIISGLIDTTGFSLINYLLGGVFGVLRAILLALLVVFVLLNSPAKSQEWFKQSTIFKWLEPAAAWIQTRVVAVLQEEEEVVKEQIRSEGGVPAVKPVTEQPSSEQLLPAPKLSGPQVSEQPSVVQPPVAQPSVKQPSVAQPPVAQPPVAQPPVQQPSVEQPSVKQPSISQPSTETGKVPGSLKIPNSIVQLS